MDVLCNVILVCTPILFFVLLNVVSICYCICKWFHWVHSLSWHALMIISNKMSATSSDDGCAESDYTGCMWYRCKEGVAAPAKCTTLTEHRVRQRLHVSQSNSYRGNHWKLKHPIVFLTNNGGNDILCIICRAATSASIKTSKALHNTIQQ